MRAAAVLMLFSACTERVDLTPTWPEGTSGTAVYRLNKEARVVVGLGRMRTIRHGRIALRVTEGGDLGGDSLTLGYTHQDLRMEREAQGEYVELTTASDIPATLQADFDYEGVPREAIIAPDGTVAIDSDRPLDTDPSMLFEPLLHAPDGRVPVGKTWWFTRSGSGETARYRTFKLDSVTDGVAYIRMLEPIGHPTTGELGPEETRVRGRLWVDVATGLPLRLHVRDKSSRAVGYDNLVDFTWEGVTTTAPDPG